MGSCARGLGRVCEGVPCGRCSIRESQASSLRQQLNEKVSGHRVCQGRAVGRTYSAGFVETYSAAEGMEVAPAVEALLAQDSAVATCLFNSRCGFLVDRGPSFSSGWLARRATRWRFGVRMGMGAL